MIGKGCEAANRGGLALRKLCATSADSRVASTLRVICRPDAVIEAIQENSAFRAQPFARGDLNQHLLMHMCGAFKQIKLGLAGHGAPSRF